MDIIKKQTMLSKVSGSKINCKAMIKNARLILRFNLLQVIRTLTDFIVKHDQGDRAASKKEL